MKIMKNNREFYLQIEGFECGGIGGCKMLSNNEKCLLNLLMDGQSLRCLVKGHLERLVEFYNDKYNPYWFVMWCFWLFR